MKEIEIEKLEELDKNTLYHIVIPKDSTASAVEEFVKAAQRLDLKMFITIGDVQLERMIDVLNKLDKEKKKEVFDLLSKDDTQE